MNWLFGTDGFPPRWRCGPGWEAEPWVGWLHVVGDALIAAAYTSIPLLLIYLVSKRNDVPFHWLGGLFAAFILACGATHALDAIIFWEPLYRLSGMMKALTAAVSWATVAALLLVLPAILHLPGRAKLADSLEAEIAERHRAEAAERSAREAAEAANVAKSRFLAAMSHELRTPLTAVLGYADLLARALENPDSRDMARQIRANGNHLLTLLNDLLDLSKVEAGKLEIDWQPVELVPLVEEVRSLMNVQAAERGLKLEVGYLGPVPRFVVTDPVRLRQCLLNLLSNAIKFTDRGRVRMEVRFLPGDPADATADLTADLTADADAPSESRPPRVRFDVSDTGVGMTAEQLTGLFRPFGQVDEEATRRAGGTGLGLAITKRLAEMLGGDVRVESEPGAGSTFTLTVAAGETVDREFVEPVGQETGEIPVGGGSIGVADGTAGGATRERIPHALPGGAGEGRSFRDHASAPLPLAGTPVRVLLAEDTRALRKLTTRLLTAAAHKVTETEDGRAAVEAWTADPGAFDVILLDMQMPRLDGFGAAAELRAAGCTAPIVALTAGAMADDRERCAAVGCDAYLAKPFEAEVLLRTVAELAERGAAPPPAD